MTIETDESEIGAAKAGKQESGRHIKLENIRKTFAGGSIVAVDDVTLDIQPTEFVVLLGPSGCGKTTTLRCIAGLEDPDSGHVFIGDEDVTHKKPKDRDIAFVFQSIALFPHMSVRKNISFGLDMATDLSEATKKQRVHEVAEMLGLEEMLDRQPSALSGGQQQRVSLGRAMVMDPSAFLLDEPFSALDANLRDQMQVETKQLQRRLETAMIFVTHDQEEALTLGDKIVIMNEGEIQQIGTPYEIYNEPENYFVAQFIGSPSTNFFDADVLINNGTARLDARFFNMALSEEQTQRFSGSGGQRVKLGVRPPYLNTNPKDPLFEAQVSVIEPQGDRDSVHLLAGDNIEITALTDQEKVRQDNGTVPIAFDKEKVWLFDENGERLL